MPTPEWSAPTVQLTMSMPQASLSQRQEHPIRA
jgi:hypothetical protein